MSTSKHTILSLTRDELIALLKRTGFCARQYDLLHVKWEAACTRAQQLRRAYSDALQAEMSAFDNARGLTGAAGRKAAQRHLDASASADKARRAVDRAEKGEDQIWREFEAANFSEYAAWGDRNHD